MVNMICRCLLTVLLILPPAYAQNVIDLERRVSELEAKMRLVDPAFGRDSRASDLVARLEMLEKKLGEVLAAKKTEAQPSPAEATAASQPAQPPGQGLVPVSVSGDYQTSTGGETRLPVAGYMDFHLNKDSGDPFRPDFHRFVLLFGHSFSDRIKFWSELEVEHALVEGGEETGEVALEQAYLDFLIKPAFNIRAGMMLVPFGIVNERHEPPSFNGVERPFVETVIIPTTWRELGFGFTGDLGKGFRYRAYLTSSLDASRFNAEAGITEGRTAGFDSSFRNPAKMVRLEYAGMRRLTLGTSLYSGHAGFNTPGVNPRVTMAGFDGRYNYRRFDVRGLFANTWVSQAGELNRRLEQQFGVNPNVARQMRGYYLEPGVHVLPRRTRNDVILFTRYEKYNTQHRMPLGYLPLPQFNRSSWITGVTYKPNGDVAIKFDYVWNRNASQVVGAINGINLGIGWWF
ncbi:MAG: hypothetical protein HY820_33340 [Acidobacteria bacterium]|nr:hypothetical protein [Acidobacteriota bacterium]